MEKLGEWCSIPVTYAGGAKDIHDLDRVAKLSHGKVDLTIGSALDIFGGSLEFSKCIEWNDNHKTPSPTASEELRKIFNNNIVTSPTIRQPSQGRVAPVDPNRMDVGETEKPTEGSTD